MSGLGGGPSGSHGAALPPGRLNPGPTCLVDFSRPLDFAFLGRTVRGCAGDTVASALFAAGVRVFSRSLKYHRPRGLYTLEGESANTYMSIDGTPNECAETTELRADMSVHAQNVRGDPRTDLFGLINRFDRLMPAGFYYRLFHRPYRLWPLFQDGLRRMAGTGVLDPSASRSGEGVRAERYLNTDVAVVGGGAGGMVTALEAAEAGLRVCLFERRTQLGGHLAWRVRDCEGEPLHQRAERMARRIRAAENVRVFTRSPVTGVWGENLLTGFTVGADGDPFRECHWECRAKTVVIAAGCMDRPLVFNHNDRPGVMQAGAAWRLAREWAVRPGWRAVFSVGDDLSLEAAVDLADLGVDVRGVADARGEGRQDPALVAALEERGIPLLPGWAVARTMGSRRVKACELRPVSGGGTSHLPCDLLVANAGTQPRIGTLATAKARLAYCTHTHSCQPVSLPDGVFVAGSMTGLRDPRAIEASGRRAGRSAVEACAVGVVGGNGSGDVAIQGSETSEAVAAGASGGPTADRCAAQAGGSRRDDADLPGPVPGCDIRHGPGIGRGAKAFVDLDEDGTYKNVRESAAQGFDVPELAKRFGGFGLGPGQYRVTAQNLAMIMADLRGDPVESAAPTTVRPPLVPPSLATLAGPGHDVHKRTPLHAEQAATGAIFRRAGPWARARYFRHLPGADRGVPPAHADRAAGVRGNDPVRTNALRNPSRIPDLCRDEILNVRTNVGILDSSPLGKFRIFGPDALNALQRVYISNMSKARSGRCTYSAMCNDMGQLMDDGVVVKEGEDDYYFTTSSGRAGSTVEWFRFHTRHDGWDYNLVNLTDVLGSINIAGPNARRVLERVTTDDVSNRAFPYMGCRRITVTDGVEARCLRLGFVGELSFELHAPASRCAYLWELLLEAGADLGVRPFGLEAQFCLRAEKGHVIIGAESEQRVTLTDIGMGWMWDRADTASKKVGAPALRACEEQPGRMKLVGFRVDDGPGVPGGATDQGQASGPARAASGPRDGALVVSGDEIVGYVCTTRRSDTLGWQYGMALVRDGHAVKGGKIVLQEEEAPGRRATFAATVTSPHFYDRTGERLRA